MWHNSCGSTPRTSHHDYQRRNRFVGATVEAGTEINQQFEQKKERKVMKQIWQRSFFASATIAAMCAAQTSNAAPVITSNPSTILGFESGLTVETFDNIAGITAVPITDYTVRDLTGTAALFNKDPAQPAFYNSGGASFNDPVGNPGVPIGIVAPGGTIAANKFSGNNVAGPINVVPPPFTLFEPGAFMEMIFPTGVSSVGLYVASGTVTVNLKDANNSNLSTGDFTGTASIGQYIGFTRSSADVMGVTLIGTGAFTIDDFSYGNKAATSVPDTGETALTLAVACGLLCLVNRKLTARLS
jgi:hypothetical protein